MVNGREIEVVKTLVEQCKDVCPHWEILFGHLHSIDEEASANSSGLTQRGLKGPLNLGSNSQRDDTQAEDAENDDDDSDADLYRPGITTTFTDGDIDPDLESQTLDIDMFGLDSPGAFGGASAAESASESQAQSQFSMTSSATLTEDTQYTWEATPERNVAPPAKTHKVQTASTPKPKPAGRPMAFRSRALSTTQASGTSISDDSAFPWDATQQEHRGSISQSSPSIVSPIRVRGKATPATPSTLNSLAGMGSAGDAAETRKRKLTVQSPFPVQTQDDYSLLSEDDEEPEEREAEKPSKILKGKAKASDIAGIIERRARGGPARKRQSKMDEEVDLKMQILRARDRRLAVDEMKYRFRAGEKSAEQRQHELAIAEFEYKREQAKAEQEAH